MNKDIETLREAANMLFPIMLDDLAERVRAIADRMKAQSKAEPVGYFQYGANGVISAVRMEFHKDPDVFPLFKHPPADARDAERLNFIARVGGGIRQVTDGRKIAISWGVNFPKEGATLEENIRISIDAAIAAKDGKDDK